MRVLVTGAAGSIGRALLDRLPALGHDVRGLDLVDPPAVPSLGWVRGSVLEHDVADAGVDGVDAVVHLAGNPDESSLPEALESHAVSTTVLLEAMRRAGVQRMAYASSNHAVGQVPREVGTLRVDVPVRPDTFYGVGKVAAEGLLSLYADRWGMSTTAMRIGSFLERPTSVRALSTWLSPDDAARMVHAAVSHGRPGFHVLHGISANTRGWWDLEPGRALGFDPQDDAEGWAHDVEPSADDARDGARVGGPMATEDHVVPAFEEDA